MKHLAIVLAFLSLITTSAAFVASPKISIIHTEKHESYSYMASALSEMPRPSFEDRMRKLVFANRRKGAGSKKSENHLPKNMKIARTLSEYRDIVANEEERIVVVRFYAEWCRACKAMRPLFYRLANQLPNTLFVEVPVTESNANLHQGLGVPSLPFGHIYTPEGGLVEESRISRRKFSIFTLKLKSYLSRSCELVDGEVSSPYTTLKKDDVASSVV